MNDMCAPKTGERVGDVPLPLVEVAAAVVVRRKDVGLAPKNIPVLAVFNHTWGGFTFPMSKPRTWPGPLTETGLVKETPMAAAARAAAEWLGCTTMPTQLATASFVQWSEHDGGWKSYTIHMFGMLVDAELQEHQPAEWLTVDELASRAPISGTVFQLLDALFGATAAAKVDLSKLP